MRRTFTGTPLLLSPHLCCFKRNAPAFSRRRPTPTAPPPRDRNVRPAALERATLLSASVTASSSRTGAEEELGRSQARVSSAHHTNATLASGTATPPPPASAAGSSVYPLLPTPPSTFIVAGLDDVLELSSPSSDTAEKKGKDKIVASAPVRVEGQALWRASRMVREQKRIRRAHGVCLVGGAESIQRIWAEYGIRPHVVYIPEEEEEVPVNAGDGKRSAAAAADRVPRWCVDAAAAFASPTYVIRAPGVMIQRQLLHATLSTPHAAEFPCHPETRLRSLSDAVSPSADPIPALLVLVGLRIPGNVGALIHAAEAMGFTNIALVHCTDPFHEKVLRGSKGSVLSPRLQLWEWDTAATSSLVTLLSQIAVAHHLFPLLAVPSQEAPQGFEIAKRFHAHNNRFRRDGRPMTASEEKLLVVTPPPQKEIHPAGLSVSKPSSSCSTQTPWGPMIVLGGESGGLHALDDAPWSVPFQSVTIPIPNESIIDSLNVAVAGGILMDLFRPSAAEKFRLLQQKTGDQPPPLIERTGDEQEEKTL